MLYNNITQSPISDAARFFRQKNGQIRFEEKPQRNAKSRQPEMEKSNKKYELTLS